MNNIYCPFCGKKVKYKLIRKNIEIFKNVNVDTYEEVPVCDECNNELYIDAIEQNNINRIYDIYRTKTNTIAPDDIVNLRKKYDLSQRELTSILSFGKMTINRYENGCLPTKTHNDYLKLIIENQNEFLKIVNDALKTKRINKKTYNKIFVNEPTELETIQDAYRELIEYSFSDTPNIYNGYKTFNLTLLENIISYIASNVNNLTITSLNKYLWFIDVLSFNQRGVSITGLKYQKQQYGPTINNFLYEPIALLNNKYEKINNDCEYNTTSTIISKNNFSLEQLSKNELDIINYIIELLKDKSVTDISNLSHCENGWKNTTLRELIPFDKSLNLKIIGEN